MNTDQIKAEIDDYGFAVRFLIVAAIGTFLPIVLLFLYCLIMDLLGISLKRETDYRPLVVIYDRENRQLILSEPPPQNNNPVDAPTIAGRESPPPSRK